MRSLLTLACLALVAGCSNETETPPEGDPREAVLSTIVEQVAIPTYQTFRDEAVALDAAAEAFCADRTAASLTTVQEAWWTARGSWKRNDIFAFGPHTDEPVRLGPKIDFWPARPDTVQRTLDGTAELDAAGIESLGAPAKGLPAMEYLLYDPSGDHSAILAAYTDETSGDRRCQYLIGLAGDLVLRADEMLAAWDGMGGFGEALVTAGEGSPLYDSRAMAINTLFNRITFAAEDIRELKIGKPAGKRNGGDPQPDTVESPFSHRSVQDIVDSLAGLRAAYAGTAENVSFDAQVEGRAPELTTALQDHFDRATTAVQAIDTPLASAVVDRPDEVEAAYQAVKDLHRALGVDAANVLGITVMFNNTDAD